MVDVDIHAQSFMVVVEEKTMTLVLLLANTAAAQDARSFDWIDPDEWSARDTALAWVNELTPNQTIEGGVVRDPDEENIVYFATSAPEGGGSLLSIYRYDEVGQWYWRLWRATYNMGDVPELGNVLPEWDVVGYDSGRVVYLQTTGGYDEGVCGENLVRGMDGTDGSALFSLPDNFDQSWSEGPSPYTVAQQDGDPVRERQTACENAGTGEPQ